MKVQWKSPPRVIAATQEAVKDGDVVDVPDEVGVSLIDQGLAVKAGAKSGPKAEEE